MASPRAPGRHERRPPRLSATMRHTRHDLKNNFYGKTF